MLTNVDPYANISESLRDSDSYGRVVELVDSLDSGSSVHCGRAGSSPASPTKNKRTSTWMSFYFCFGWTSACRRFRRLQHHNVIKSRLAGNIYNVGCLYTRNQKGGIVMNKNELLYRIFGYDSFRPGQDKLIDAVLSGRDVFGIMPTGGG